MHKNDSRAILVRGIGIWLGFIERFRRSQVTSNKRRQRRELLQLLPINNNGTLAARQS
jgi:hypothetical protein